MEAMRHNLQATPGDGNERLRKKSILEVAAALFALQGYSSTSMREVAAATGLSKAGLYHHFATKDAILEAIAEQAMDALAGELERVLRMEEPIETRLRELTVGRLEVIAANHDAIKVFWQERRFISAGGNETFDRRMRAYHDEVLALIEDGQHRGAIRADIDAHLLLLALLGMTGWAYLWFKPDGRLSANAIGHNFWNLLRDGVAPNEVPMVISA